MARGEEEEEVVGGSGGEEGEARGSSGGGGRRRWWWGEDEGRDSKLPGARRYSVSYYFFRWMIVDDRRPTFVDLFFCRPCLESQKPRVKCQPKEVGTMPRGLRVK